VSRLALNFLDRFGQDDGRPLLVFDCGTIGGVNLVRIVSAAVEPFKLLVR
jgi:hypothetical protein